MADEIVGRSPSACMGERHCPYARAEVGGRRCRQPGQVRKEAATTISCRVVGFHRSQCGASPPKPTSMNDDGSPASSPGLGLDLPEPPEAPSAASPYRVLARKYRPQTFAELI